MVEQRSELGVRMNGALVGQLRHSNSGAMSFQYAESWLATPGARPISLSLPLRQSAYEGTFVYNFFDNLLPDNDRLRARIQARFQVPSRQPFDLLAAIGADCVGAIQLCRDLEPVPDVEVITAQPLSESNIAATLRGSSPLGMQQDVDDFRISIAGAQEKTALLWHQGQWCRPKGATPTSHIFKLPIGVLSNNNIDLSDSCENEWLCLEIARAFGLPTAAAAIHHFEDVKVLVVERFDRRWSEDRRWLMRLPQEDFCQALGVSPSLKYQADGGPGIAAIMKVLLGAQNPDADRALFFRTQILFWLLAATDGHAKNFSLFLESGGRYRLTPLYDVMSVYPMMRTNTIPRQKAKMAMALRGSKNYYQWAILQPRHFISTAQAIGFSSQSAAIILQDMCDRTAAVVTQIATRLPPGFPTYVSEPIFQGMLNLAQQDRLERNRIDAI
jgi:serine/threonine-protein kinase HipA